MHAPRAAWLLLLVAAAAWAGCAPIWPDLDSVAVGKNLSVPRNGGFVPYEGAFCSLQFTGYDTAPAGMVRYPRFDSFNITGNLELYLYDWNGVGFPYYGTDRPVNMSASRVTLSTCNATRVPGFRAVYTQSTGVKCKNNTVVKVSGSGGYFSTPTPAGPGFEHVAPYHCGWNITLTGVGPEYTAVELTVYMNDDGESDEYVVVTGPGIGSEGINAYHSIYGDPIYFRKTALVSYGIERSYGSYVPVGLGFRAFWRPIKLCTVGMNVTVGTVIAPWPEPPDSANSWGYKSPADNCTWVVNAPAGQRILLLLRTSEYSAYDFRVTVHDGSNDAAPCLFDSDVSSGGTAVIRSSGARLFVRSEVYDYDQSFATLRFRGVTSLLVDGQVFCDRCTTFTGDNATYYNGDPQINNALRLEGQTCTFQFTPTAGAYGIMMNLTSNITVSNVERTLFQVGNGYGSTISNDCFYCSDPGVLYDTKSATYPPVPMYMTMNPPYYLCGGCTYYGGAFKLSFTSLMPEQCSGRRVIVGPTTIANPTPSNFHTRYLNNSDCIWVIYGGGHLMPIVSMYFYATDLAPGCGDRITVYDGDSETAPVLATLCGNQTGLVTASGGAMAVKFISDAGNEASGFSAQTQCHGVMLVGDGIEQGGEFFSNPLAPDGGLVAINTSCTWIVRVPENYVVYMSGSHDLAPYDTLIAYDGDSTDYPPYDLSNGYFITYHSSRNVVTVVWNSPASEYPGAQSHVGFRIRWSMCDETSGDFSAWQPPGYGYGPITQAAWVQAPKAFNGAKLATTSNSSIIFTPQYPDDKIMYIPLGLSLGKGNVSLYAVGNRKPFAVFTGSGARLPLVNLGAASNISAIELVYSPAAVPAQGFLGLFIKQRANATCAPLETVAIAAEEVITMPKTNYGVLNYEPSAYCFQVLTVSSGRVGLNITEMDIQPSGYCMADALEVYDGGEPSAPKIGSYCGQAPPTMIVGSTTSLLLVFRSDGFFTQYKGFSAIVGPTTLPATTGATGMTTDATTTLPPVTTAPGTGTLTSTLTSTTDATSTTSTTSDGGVAEINNGKTGVDAFLGMLGGNMLYVLIGVGALVLICICALIIVCLRRRRRGGYNPESTVQLDLMQTTMKASFDSGMKARVEGLLKAGSTKKIGTGGTAKVYRAEMDGKMVALKVLSEKNVKASLEFHREANILSRLTTTTNSHVIQLMFFCDDPPCLVCELAENGSLSGIRSEFKSYAADKQKDILFQVSEGMEFLHANSIVHLDLKPDNVLLGVGGVCKISDFGSSAILGEDLEMSLDGLTAVRDFNGTPHYAAPERFRLRMKIDMKKADVFSFGVMAWSLMSGEAPYAKETGASIMGVYSSMKEGDPITLMPLDMSVLNGIDTVYAGITRECMDPTFVRRPSFVDVSGMLRSNNVDRTRIVSPSAAGSFNSGYNSQFNSENMYGSEIDSGSAATRNPTFDSFNTSTAATGSMRGPPTLAGSRTDVLRGPGSRSGSRADQTPPPNPTAAAGGGHPRTGSNAEPPSRPSRAGSAADQRPANYPRSASATRPGPPPPPRS